MTESGVGAAAREEGDEAATENGVETATEISVETAAREEGDEAADNDDTAGATLLASHGRGWCRRGVKSSDNAAATSHGNEQRRRTSEAILAGQARLRRWASLLVSVPLAQERESKSAQRQGDEVR